MDLLVYLLGYIHTTIEDQQSTDQSLDKYQLAPVDPDAGLTLVVPSTWLAPVDPGSRSNHADSGPRPITADPSTRPAW